MNTIALPYLEGYAPEILAGARVMLAEGCLGDYLAKRYPEAHEVRSDKALFEAAMALKNRYLRTAPPLDKVRYDGTLQVLTQTLGLHTRQSRIQGSRLKATREIRVATVFRDAPAAFLRMILVHELAHLKEIEHTKAFYQLCEHMAPDYFRLELDLRLYLTWLEQQA